MFGTGVGKGGIIPHGGKRQWTGSWVPRTAVPFTGKKPPFTENLL
jgi:hypothetical protein